MELVIGAVNMICEIHFFGEVWRILQKSQTENKTQKHFMPYGKTDFAQVNVNFFQWL